MTATDLPVTTPPPDPTAIAIVGYRNAADVQQCVAKLLEGSDTNFIVLVCENGGASSFEDLVAALSTLASHEHAPASRDPAVEAVWRGHLRGGQVIEALLAADNLGYAGGVNAAIARLDVFPRWAAVWVLNADTEPDRDGLAALVAKARSDPGYGIIGSRLVLVGTGRVQAYGGRYRKFTGRGFNIGLNRPADAQPDAAAVEREMTYVLGASMYVTRAYVEEVGRMTDDYFLYSEEIDWCLRRGRYRLGFAPQSIIHHHHGAAIGSSLSRRAKSRLSVYLDERNKLIVSRRFYPTLYPLVVAASLLLMAQYVRARAFGNLIAGLQGWWAGLRGEVGRPFRFR